MFLTNQPFNETPDGTRTLFTTATPFVADSLIVTQGGLTISNWTVISTISIEFDAAPLAANGALKWSGDEVDTGSTPLATNGFWTLSDFRDTFGVTTGTDAAVAFALARADAALQRFLQAEIYADAQLTTPDDAARALMIRGAAGALARLYLTEMQVLTGAVTSRTQSYNGVKTYAESFSASNTAQTAAQSEGEILASLSLYEQVTTPTDVTAAAGVVWWGTGRWPL